MCCHFVCAAPHENECNRFGRAPIIQNQSTFSFVTELNIYIIMCEREKQFCLFLSPHSRILLLAQAVH